MTVKSFLKHLFALLSRSRLPVPASKPQLAGRVSILQFFHLTAAVFSCMVNNKASSVQLWLGSFSPAKLHALTAALKLIWSFKHHQLCMERGRSNCWQFHSVLQLSILVAPAFHLTPGLSLLPALPRACLGIQAIPDLSRLSPSTSQHKHLKAKAKFGLMRSWQALIDALNVMAFGVTCLNWSTALLTIRTSI